MVRWSQERLPMGAKLQANARRFEGQHAGQQHAQDGARHDVAAAVVRKAKAVRTRPFFGRQRTFEDG
jgi:hypothetical protein